MSIKKKMLTAVLACFALALAVGPVSADHPSGVQDRDLWRLQDEIDALDAALAALPANHPRTQEFIDRADQLREDVTWLKVQMRRHQSDRREGLGASSEDVAWVRENIRRLHDDVLAAGNMRFVGGEARLPEGTEIEVRLEEPLSSATARIEDQVDATVARPVLIDGRVVVPSGARVRGTVVGVDRAERPAKGGRLDLRFDTLLLDDGTRVNLRSRIMEVGGGLDRGDTAKRAGIGAAVGAILGSVIGGTKGALLGILVGGTGGIAASKGQELELPAGTVLRLRLEQPVTVTARR